MRYTLIPFNFTNLTTAQQDSAFQSWCGSVMAELDALKLNAVLKFEAKGDVGLTPNKVIQKADVWIEGLPVNVMLAFGDMLDTDTPNQSRPEEKRNFPNVKAKALLESAKELSQAYAAGTLGLYEVLPRPEKADITV